MGPSKEFRTVGPKTEKDMLPKVTWQKRGTESSKVSRERSVLDDKAKEQCNKGKLFVTLTFLFHSSAHDGPRPNETGSPWNLGGFTLDFSFLSISFFPFSPSIVLCFHCLSTLPAH